MTYHCPLWPHLGPSEQASWIIATLLGWWPPIGFGRPALVGMAWVLDKGQDCPLIHSSVVHWVACTVRYCFSKSKDVVSTYEKLPVQWDLLLQPSLLVGQKGNLLRLTGEMLYKTSMRTSDHTECRWRKNKIASRFGKCFGGALCCKPRLSGVALWLR